MSESTNPLAIARTKVLPLFILPSRTICVRDSYPAQTSIACHLPSLLLSEPNVLTPITIECLHQTEYRVMTMMLQREALTPLHTLVEASSMMRSGGAGSFYTDN